jgi:hypothetical protein
MGDGAPGRAAVVAVNLCDAHCLQPKPGQSGQIGKVFSTFTAFGKQLRGPRQHRFKRGLDLRPDLKGRRPDARPQPRYHFSSW